MPWRKFTGMGTYGYAISKDAKNPAAAWDFVKYLVSEESQLAIMNNYAGMPLLQSLREDPAVTELPGPPDNITAFIENGENGILPTYFPGECGSLYAGQIDQEITDAFEAVLAQDLVGDGRLHGRQRQHPGLPGRLIVPVRSDSDTTGRGRESSPGRRIRSLIKSTDTRERSWLPRGPPGAVAIPRSGAGRSSATRSSRRSSWA